MDPIDLDLLRKLDGMTPKQLRTWHDAQPSHRLSELQETHGSHLQSSVDGSADETMLKRLGRKLQSTLNAHNADVTVSKYAGQSTSKTVKELQLGYGLKASGARKLAGELQELSLSTHKDAPKARQRLVGALKTLLFKMKPDRGGFGYGDMRELVRATEKLTGRGSAGAKTEVASLLLASKPKDKGQADLHQSRFSALVRSDPAGVLGGLAGRGQDVSKLVKKLALHEYDLDPEKGTTRLAEMLKGMASAKGSASTRKAALRGAEAAVDVIAGRMKAHVKRGALILKAVLFPLKAIKIASGIAIGGQKRKEYKSVDAWANDLKHAFRNAAGNP